MDAVRGLPAPPRAPWPLLGAPRDLRLLAVPALRHLPFAALVAAYALRFATLSVAVYDGYGSPAYDMAIPDQGIWLLSRFHAPFSTVMGRDVFGDHTSFIFVLLVPLFWVYAHAAALLVVQSLLLAGAAIPIYLYALHRLGSSGMATVLAASYLLNPALQHGNLEQFHVEAFTVPLLALALWAALERRNRLLVVSVALLLCCKEDVGLLVAPLAAWVLWRRNRSLGGGLLAATVVWSILASEVLIPSLVGVVNVHAGRIPFGGLGGTVRTIVRRPGAFATYLLSEGRPFYVWQMLFSAGLVLFRAPEIAAVGVLGLTVNVVSSFGYEHQILYHYSMPLAPVLVMGTVFAVASLRTERRRRWATGAVGVCALWSCVLWGLAPFSVQTYPHQSPSSPEVHDTDTVLRALPAGAVVSAYYPYVAHIDHRTRIYMWPNPFSAQYWDTFRQEGRRLPFAGQVRYLVLPTDLTGQDGQVFASVAPSFHIVAQAGDVALYERGP